MTTESDIIGFVEKITRQKISGWVQSRSGGHIDLGMSVDGKVQVLDPIWSPRPDVAPSMGGSPQNTGFVVPLLASEEGLFSAIGDDVRKFEILANGIVLPLVDGFQFDRPSLATPPEKPSALHPVAAGQLRRTRALQGGSQPSPAPGDSASPPLASDESACEAAGKADIVGYVEKIDLQEIVGWAVSRSGASMQFALEIGSESRPVVPRWTPRPDVPPAIRGDEENIGYLLRLHGSVTERLRSVIADGGSFRVLANGVELNRVKGIKLPEVRKTGKSQRTRSAGNVEKVTPFLISGWCVGAVGKPGRLSLLSNGEEVDCPVSRRSRLDVASELRLEDPDVGFDIDLPSSIWRNVDADGACELEILVDGQVIPGRDLVVTRELAADWVAQVLKLPDGMERQFLTLGAVEHLRTGNFFDLLDESLVPTIENFVKSMNLDDFLFAEGGAKRKAEKAPGESGSTLLLWDAMHELNGLMGEPGSKVLPHIRQILEVRRLRGHAREWFLNLSVQLTCDSGEFLQLRELLDFNQVQKFEYSQAPNQLSLALPALVADNHIGRATDLVWRLSKLLFSGWLHTECIRYSLQLVQEKEATGEIETLAAERFRNAIVGLLNGFNADWFGRMHDRELCDSMILALTGLERYTDYHRNDLVAATIRLLGLNPTFWKRWQDGSDRPFHAELARAEAHWTTLSGVLYAPMALLAVNLEATVAPLRYFWRNGNPEVSIFLRELVMAALPRCGTDLNQAGRDLLEMLLANSAVEAVRVAAFPGEGAVGHRRHLPMTDSELRQLIRKIGDRRQSPTYDLQIAAASAVMQFKDALAQNDAERMLAAIEQFESAAILLSCAQAGFVGLDLLATAYLLAADAGSDGECYLSLLMEGVRRICDDLSTDRVLPVPAQSALQTLGALPEDDPARRFIDEMMGMVRGCFGERYDDLFELQPELEPKKPKALEIAARGYPHDTLVMIYSCRENLDTRVKAIRESWLPDLIEAGVPYLIVVGDGDDSVAGDILQLRVGDGLQHTAAKTLRMFEWAYDRTDAQFVLKIEDDCYLDVGRYFDSLSYRKHAYYGRVVECKPGAIKRLIQIPKTARSAAITLVDRSPEPSYFADGRAGYCLSRLAMLKLLEAREESAGQRLIGASFYEDKLVGDLLASQGLWAGDEDSFAYQQRALGQGAMPVSAGEDNTFYPGVLTPTKIAHLGAAINREPFPEAEGLYPKKIWPTCWSPNIAVESSQLQLLSPQPKVADLLRHEAVVVAVVRNEQTMMPHFLEHYRALGLQCFIIVDNCSNDGTREYLAAQPDVVLYSTDTEYKYSHYGVSWQQAVLGSHCLGKWVILADADEFLVFENSESRPFAELLKTFEGQGANGALTYMIDMYPYGDLDDACFNTGKPFDVAPYFEREPLIELRFGGGQYSNSRNFVNGLRHRVAPSRINAYVSQKYAVFRYFPWIRLSEGVHYAANLQVSATPVFFAHFKYHSGFKKKVTDEIKRNQHYNGAEEYRRYAAMLAEGAGRFGSDQDSTRYHSSHDFLRLVGGPSETSENNTAA